MIFDAVAFREMLDESNIRDKALRLLTDRLEERFGVRITRDVRAIPYGRPDLIEPFKRALKLKQHGVIEEFGPVIRVTDEPPTKAWYAICSDEAKHQTGGTSWNSDADAFYAAISEALERYIWTTQDDYFVNPKVATLDEIAKFGAHIAPQDFVGYSADQRALHSVRILRPDAKYLWIQGVSLTNNKPVYVPAQVVIGIGRHRWQVRDEPIIRQQNTNGLATWPTQSGARLAGVQEVIEREAYMVMWLNQLTLPRIALKSLCASDPTLAKAVATCERYNFKVHAVQLLTDAPTHAVIAVLEDMSGHAPRFSVGLKSHRSLSYAIEKAMTEALRGFRSYYLWSKTGSTWDNSTPIDKIGHRERLHYWGVPENAKHLEFMVSGKEIAPEKKEWENDSIEENLDRLVQWCREKNFDCISVPLTSSAKNPTELHIEMVVMPQLQPTYLNDASQEFGGSRWHDVPKALGYAPREKPFAERPHPFS